MANENFSIIRSKPIHVMEENVDTDQIIPARFLTTTKKDGLGNGLFYDWRYDDKGNPHKDNIFNQPWAKTCQILVAGANFGCGSSREHAPWALYDFGFRVILSTKFADIFKNNAPKARLLPVVIDDAYHKLLMGQPDLEITLDLEKGEIRAGNEAPFKFEVDAFVRSQLLQGREDLDYLLGCQEAITKYEDKVA